MHVALRVSLQATARSGARVQCRRPLDGRGAAGTVDPAECGAYEAGMRQCATDIDTYLRTNVLTPCRMRSGGSRQIATLGLKQTLLTRPYGIDIVLAS